MWVLELDKDYYCALVAWPYLSLPFHPSIIMFHPAASVQAVGAHPFECSKLVNNISIYNIIFAHSIFPKNIQLRTHGHTPASNMVSRDTGNTLRFSMATMFVSTTECRWLHHCKEEKKYECICVSSQIKKRKKKEKCASNMI